MDVTLPGRVPLVGRRHPLTHVRERIEDIFARMGYEIIDGPELEDDWHNFEALNMPPDHPARDMQDTLYLAAPVPVDVARPPGDAAAHAHVRHADPLHGVARSRRCASSRPGRVYRRDNFDATHTPMFTQVEGLVVGEGISLGDLKGTLNAFAAASFFDAEREDALPSELLPVHRAVGRARRRVSGTAAAAGCGLCKQTGWIEVLGCGMVHPAVFEAVGYDAGALHRASRSASASSGWRSALYGIDDIRMFYENDLRFLEQLAL